VMNKPLYLELWPVGLVMRGQCKQPYHATRSAALPICHTDGTSQTTSAPASTCSRDYCEMTRNARNLWMGYQAKHVLDANVASCCGCETSLFLHGSADTASAFTAFGTLSGGALTRAGEEARWLSRGLRSATVPFRHTIQAFKNGPRRRKI
jgi:hypothetical protein